MQKAFSKINRLNIYAAVLHLLQGFLIIYLSRNVTFPISVSYLNFNPVTQSLEPAAKTIFNLNLAWLVAIFFFLSAIAHLTVVTFAKKDYQKGLKAGMNKYRWYEYSLSASVMMVGISVLVGIYDLASLMMIFGLVAVMNLCGLIMEVHNQTTQKTKWISFIVGCIAGIIPWLAIGLYFWSANKFGGGNIPTFVYYIYISIFVFFNCFAINMFLQYKKWGPWKDYLFGERVYILLSLFAKSALAWQVFAGTLRP